MSTTNPISGLLNQVCDFFKSFKLVDSTPAAKPEDKPAATPAPAAPKTVAPIQQPAPAPVQKTVDVALKELTTSKSDLTDDISTLWDDQVSKASTFGKIFGVVSFIFNLPVTVAKSLIARVTASELESSATKLAKAVMKRGLTPDEQEANNTGKVKPKNFTFQNLQATTNIAAKNALKKFYDVFAKRVSQLNISKDSEVFATYVEAAQQLIRKAGQEGSAVLAGILSNENEKLRAQLLPVKLETEVEGFKGVAVVAMMDELAGKAQLEQITPDNYKSTVKGIARIAKNLALEDIEAELRNKITEKQNSKLATVIADFSDVAADSKVNKALKDQIEQALKAKQASEKAKEARISAELKPIRGEGFGQGAVNDAWEASEKARLEKEASRAAYREVRKEFGITDDSITDEKLEEVPVSDEKVSKAKADFSAKLKAYKSAFAAYQALDKACKDLLAEQAAVQVKLGEIEGKLNPDAVARAVTSTREKSLAFYEELQNAVTDDNKVARYNAMQIIINN